MDIPIGVANSVSFNFGYDPFDSINYANQSGFDIVQIYLAPDFVSQESNLKKLTDTLKTHQFSGTYFHAHGLLNPNFLSQDYARIIFAFLNDVQADRLVIHFDEKASIEDGLSVIETLTNENKRVYLENYFQESGQKSAEKNLRKYMALFTLANSQEVQLRPVIDIPRFFNDRLGLPEAEALQWCYQFFNYFGNRQIPLLLHLIDAEDTDQNRNSFTTIGEGYIPYQKIFDFMNKTSTPLEGIILEYEDKVTPLNSVDRIRDFLKE